MPHDGFIHIYEEIMYYDIGISLTGKDVGGMAFDCHSDK